MSIRYYAAYGSNLHPGRLQRRVPSARLEGTGFLPGVSLRFHKRGMDGSGKANLLASGPGAHVAVYSIALADRPVLDRHEHLGVGYEIHEVEIAGFGTCFTYLATATHIEERLSPFCWYHELVLLGCRVHGFPGDYLAQVASVPRRPDPDERRRREHWALVRTLLAHR